MDFFFISFLLTFVASSCCYSNNSIVVIGRLCVSTEWNGYLGIVEDSFIDSRNVKRYKVLVYRNSVFKRLALRETNLAIPIQQDKPILFDCISISVMPDSITYSVIDQRKALFITLLCLLEFSKDDDFVAEVRIIGAFIFFHFGHTGISYARTISGEKYSFYWKGVEDFYRIV